MVRILDRLFAFVKVQDPKQTRINRMIIAVMIIWIGGGFILNMISYAWYYLVTLPNYESQAVHQSFFQVETSWLKQLPDIPAPLFVVLLLLAVSAFTAMAKYIIRLHKEKSEAEEVFRREQQVMIQAFLPVLSEIKTVLSFLRGRE